MESRSLKIKVILPEETGSVKISLWNLGHSRSKWFYLRKPGQSRSACGIWVIQDQSDFTWGNWVTRDQPVETGSLQVNQEVQITRDLRNFTCGFWVSKDQLVELGSLKITVEIRGIWFYLWLKIKVILLKIIVFLPVEFWFLEIKGISSVESDFTFGIWVAQEQRDFTCVWWCISEKQWKVCEESHRIASLVLMELKSCGKGKDLQLLYVEGE